MSKPLVALAAGAAMVIGAASPVAAAWDITSGELIAKNDTGGVEFTIDLSATSQDCPSDPPGIDVTADEVNNTMSIGFDMNAKFELPEASGHWYRAETSVMGSGTYTGTLPGPVPFSATLPGSGFITVNFYEINGPLDANPCEDVDAGVDCIWSIQSMAITGDYTGDATPPPGQVENMDGVSSTVFASSCGVTELTAIDGGTIELSDVEAINP